jgi:hypothetical protein
MYRSVFQNSKVALVFAGMTLFSAVSMVGTSEEGGVLTDTVERLGAYRGAFGGGTEGGAETGSESDQPEAEAPVFGDYQSDEAAARPAAAAAQPQGTDPMSAPLSSTAIVAKRGSTFAGALTSSEPEPVEAPE